VDTKTAIELGKTHGITLAQKIVQRSDENGRRVQEILAKKFGVNRQRHTQDEIRKAVGVTQQKAHFTV
jgi:hypothetical protein